MSAVHTLPPHKPQGYLRPADYATAAVDWCEDLALQLETISDVNARIRLMREVVVVTGGTWIEPPLRGNWGPVEFELSVGGICVSGSDYAECIARWIRAVLRIMRKRDEGAA